MRPGMSQDSCRHFLLTPLFPCVTALVFSGLLAGCDGTRSISEVADKPNSFPPTSNALDNFDDNSTGDTNNTRGLETNEILVTVEVPGNVAPEGELTRRNLRIVDPDRIKVYETDNTLRQLASVDVDIRTENDNRRVIAFNSGVVPLGPNVIVEVSVGNTIMRSLVADSDRDVKVNPFSEYLVNNTLSSYTGPEFDQVMDCVNSTSEDLCLNLYVWSTLSDQVHDFEIDIPENLSIQQAVNYLADRPDFASYTANMAAYALLDSESSGKISASSVDYNSVLLGLELGQSFKEPSLNDPGQWGIRIAQEERLEDENGVAYIYPALTLTTLDVFNIRVTSQTSDIPYDRETLLQTATNDFFVRGPETWDLNSHATSPGAATLQDELRLLTGRALYQSITGRTSSQIIGWTRNPYFQDAYIGGGSAKTDQVITSYFSAGRAIELEEAGDQLKRQQTLENHYASFFELNLKRPANGEPDFSLEKLNNRTYNLLSFAMEFHDDSDPEPLVIDSAVGTWAVSGTGIAENSTSQVVVRSNSGLVTTRNENRTPGRTVTLRESKLPSGRQQIVRQIGRLNLDDSGIGASDPDGNLLAFNLDNDSVLGDGLVIAGAQANTAPSPGNYRVQGAVLTQDGNLNRITHFDESVLAISPSATLTLRGLEVDHTVNPSSINEPSQITERSIPLTYTYIGDGQVSFVDSDGLILEGFVTADHEKLFLRWFDGSDTDKQIGLLIATLLP